MKYKSTLTLLLFSAGASYGANILAPSNPIIAIGLSTSDSEYPGAEAPAFAIDGTLSKYLNFKGSNTGFIVTPAGGSSNVLSIGLTTANDAEGRDPSNFRVYGTNDAISSAENSIGNSESWTFISSSAVSLPSDRNTGPSYTTFSNAGSFTSYKVLFDSLKDNNELMQIAEVQLYSGADGTGSGVLSPGAPVVGIGFAPVSYPAGEAPTFAIDGVADVAGNKYLNFGKAGSGFIVTPSDPSVAKSFEITTGGDAEGRDPASYSLYGTNDSIVSADNSEGIDEAWELIQSGGLSLPSDRNATGDAVLLDSNTASYTSYKVVFDTLKSGDENSMQIAEFTLSDTIPEPSMGLLSLLGCAALVRRRRR